MMEDGDLGVQLEASKAINGWKLFSSRGNQGKKLFFLKNRIKANKAQLSKGPTDKRGWSFRKRSDRHRNTTILEDSSSGNRENSEATSIEFHGHSSPIAEKITASRSHEVNSKAPNTFVVGENASTIDSLIAKENISDTVFLSTIKDVANSPVDEALADAGSGKGIYAANVDPKMEDSFAIIIQAAIRAYLSQKALSKIKNVVKLQAAIRGHLVRSQAVGTLRCVQAIIKLQALVRARRTRILFEGSVINMKRANGTGRNDQNMTTASGKEINANPSLCVTERILGNAFARQLLESTPKKKPIHVKCDPLRPDSAWKWLERWMTASSTELPQNPQAIQKNDEQERGVDTTACEVGIKAPVVVVSGATDLESSLTQTGIISDGEKNLKGDADDFAFHFKPTTFLESPQPQFDGSGLNEAEETSLKTCTNQTESPLNVASEAVLDSPHNEPEEDTKQLEQSMKMIASEQPENEGKKIAIGSRKACNPAFVAAQSKFKELSSTATSGMPVTPIIKDIGAESKVDSLSSPKDYRAKTTESIASENSISYEPKTRVAELESGPKLSSSSTHSSPDRSEIRSAEKHQIVEEVILNPNNINDNVPTHENRDVGNPAFFHPEKAVDSRVDMGSQQPERSASDVQTQPDISMDQPACRTSPEASPRSHVTVPESYETPSSQVSVKAKRKDSNKSDHTQIRKSKSAEKKSPSNPNSNPGIRNSTEKLLKDSKSGKRRNSFGSGKTDNADQDPRESNSTSLPSYMQATESARAKAQANNSPRSSPDVQDNDFYIKKRHSLPSANGKQSSPRMPLPSSSPQAQQIAKGEQTHSSRDRWQR